GALAHAPSERVPARFLLHVATARGRRSALPRAHVRDDQRGDTAPLRLRLATLGLGPPSQDLGSPVPGRAGQAQHPRVERPAPLRTREPGPQCRYDDRRGRALNGRVRIGTLAELAARGRLVEAVDGREVVVIEHAGVLRAYENNCPHLGGPVGEGKLVARVESVVDEEDGGVFEERCVPSDVRLVCPWHGYEFDFQSGACAADARIRLRARSVVVEGQEIYVNR